MYQVMMYLSIYLDREGGHRGRRAAQVTEGSGRALVVAVGESSEWGRTMALVASESQDTPLQVSSRAFFYLYLLPFHSYLYLNFHGSGGACMLKRCWYTPLQESLGSLASAIGKVGLVVGALCFVILFIRRAAIVFSPFVQGFTVSFPDLHLPRCQCPLRCCPLRRVQSSHYS